MKTYNTVYHLQNKLDQIRNQGLTIGFVPTMGALHNGHLSLIKAAKESCDVVVCSIFVNPTQFNTEEDLVKYPRTIPEDSLMLSSEGCDILFAPSVKQIYPSGMKNYKAPNIGGILRLWEGEFRPGHFDGMMQVVERLLRIVEPHSMFMGLKDYQQFSIVKLMVDALDLKVEIHGMPIIREKSGLAMSSRNRRLSKKARTDAVVISEALTLIKEKLKEKSIAELEKIAKQHIELKKGMKIEYLAIVDSNTMLKPKNQNRKHELIAIAAVWTEGIRLIDNMLL